VSSVREKAVDWAATGVAAGGVISAMVAFDLVQRLAIRFGSDAHQRAVSQMARNINRAVRAAGVPVRAEGLEHLAPGQNYIVVSNHQSMLDISMASDFLEPLQPRYVSKRELARGVPGVSYNLAHGGSALIDRKDPKQAHAAIEGLARQVRDAHWTVMIFPEGTRSRTGAMRPFREAGLRTLVVNAPGVPVLPVTTSGGSRLFSKNLKPLVRDTELVFRVHPPVMPPAENDPAGFTAFVHQLEGIIRSAQPTADALGQA
jgi:1-acyl-sn-glycerol-3-phosphate acyltransferase